MTEQAQPQPDEAVAQDETSPTKTLTTIERITLLADLANAAQDDELSAAIRSRKNGERLHALFVKAVSDEIEAVMNPDRQPAPKTLAGVEQVSVDIYQIVQRIGGLLAAIEHGPGITALQMLVQGLGGQAPSQVVQQPQQRQVDPGQYSEQPTGSRGRGGLLGSM